MEAHPNSISPFVVFRSRYQRELPIESDSTSYSKFCSESDRSDQQEPTQEVSAYRKCLRLLKEHPERIRIGPEYSKHYVEIFLVCGINQRCKNK